MINVENILAFIKPIYLLIKFSDGEGPKMGEIYERMDIMLGDIKDAMTLKENKFSIYYPIYLLIKFSDGEGPKMGEIYERMDIMLGDIKDAMTLKENKF